MTTEPMDDNSSGESMGTIPSLVYLGGFLPGFTISVVAILHYLPLDSVLAWIIIWLTTAIQSGNIDAIGWTVLFVLVLPLLTTVPFIIGLYTGYYAVNAYTRIVDNHQ